MSGYVTQLIAAYVVGIFCTLSIEGPRNLMFKVSIIDVVGWATYLLAGEYFHVSLPLANYISGLVIAAMSHWFARIFHEPVTVFFIPGFFTLVPGGGMYRTAFYLFRGDTARGLSELSTTLFIALAIALAVFTVDSLVSIIGGQRFPKFIRRAPKRLRPRRETAQGKLYPKQAIDPALLRMSQRSPLSVTRSAAMMARYAERTQSKTPPTRSDLERAEAERLAFFVTHQSPHEATALDKDAGKNKKDAK